MLKKHLTGLLAFLLIFSLFISGAVTQEVASNEDLSETSRREEIEREYVEPEAPENPYDAESSEEPPIVMFGVTPQMEVSKDLVSMTEAREVEVTVTFQEDPDLDQLEWTFGELPFEEWKSFDTDEREYTGDPFIYFVEEPALGEGEGVVEAVVKFDLPYGMTNLSWRVVRVEYPKLIGVYDLAVENLETDEKAQAPIKLNVYDSYRLWEEIIPTIEDIIDEAREELYVEYRPYGQSVEGRDIPFVILAQDETAVNQYQEEFHPQMLEDPASLQEKLDAGDLDDYQIPIWVHNVHPDEAPGVDAQLDLLEMLTTKEEVSFMMTDEDGDEYEVVIDVDEALEELIFLFNITDNPDGRYYNTRGNVHGFDLNRDNAFQTQVEKKALAEEIASWSPVTFLDLHGFVTGFLIEPCTPPHNENYEYDLYLPNALDHAHKMGNAAITNTVYDSYFVPYEAWDWGWDDASIVYCPMYAMTHGALGHTIEMPELNQHGNDALIHIVLGSIDFVMEEKDDLFYNQLEYFRRGVEGIDDRAVDEYFVDPDREPIGRDREPYENFFPDYYVIPVERDLQNNVLEAYRMAEFLIRNGVRVERAQGEVTIENVTYPEGTFIVDMKQAKRGLANALLYDGPDLSDWPAMYAEVAKAFSDLRGFDMDTIRLEEGGSVEGVTEELNEVIIPDSVVSGEAEHYILQNVNNDTLKAVNKMLFEGRTVEMILQTGEDYSWGDFLVAKEDLEEVRDDYYLQAQAFLPGEAIATEKLTNPEVAAFGYQANFVLEQMLGFEIVDLDVANVIADDSGVAHQDSVKSRIDEDGVPYIGVSGYALRTIEWSGLLPGFELGTTSLRHEGLVQADVDTGSLVTGIYNEDEKLYSNSGSWIESVPEDSIILAELIDEEEFFVSGWWPGHEGAQGKPFVIADQVGDAEIILFANDITNRAHPHHQFRMLANAIYGSLLEAGVTEVQPSVELEGALLAKDAWQANATIPFNFKLLDEDGEPLAIEDLTVSVYKGDEEIVQYEEGRGRGAVRYHEHNGNGMVDIDTRDLGLEEGEYSIFVEFFLDGKAKSYRTPLVIR